MAYLKSYYSQVTSTCISLSTHAPILCVTQKVLTGALTRHHAVVSIVTLRANWKHNNKLHSLHNKQYAGTNDKWKVYFEWEQ
jgi:hypothetical protein